MHHNRDKLYPLHRHLLLKFPSRQYNHVVSGIVLSTQVQRAMMTQRIGLDPAE